MYALGIYLITHSHTHSHIHTPSGRPVRPPFQFWVWVGPSPDLSLRITAPNLPKPSASPPALLPELPGLMKKRAPRDKPAKPECQPTCPASRAARADDKTRSEQPNTPKPRARFYTNLPDLPELTTEPAPSTQTYQNRVLGSIRISPTCPNRRQNALRAAKPTKTVC